MSNTFSPLLNTGSLLLALAVKKSLPRARWVDMGARGETFYVDFYLPSPINQAISEEVVQQSLRSLSNLSFSSREMVLENALAYLKHHKGMWPESITESISQEVVSVFEGDGEFLLGKSGEFAPTNSAHSFRLWKLVELPAEYDFDNEMAAVRLIGYAVQDSAELPTIRKQLTTAKKNDHVTLGEELGLFIAPSIDLGAWIWLAKGLQWKEALLKWIVKSSSAEIIEGSVDTGADNWQAEIRAEHLLCFLKNRSHHSFGQKIFLYPDPIPFASAWELYGCSRKTSFVTHSFFSTGSAVESLISSLHQIEKTYKMLGVEYYWAWRFAKPKGRLKQNVWDEKRQLALNAIQRCSLKGESLPSEEGQRGPRFDLLVKDRFGQPWCVASITIDATPIPDFTNVVLVEVNALVSLETLMALLLEQHTKDFPKALQWLIEE